MSTGLPGFTRRTLMWTVTIAALALTASSVHALTTILHSTTGPGAPPPRPDGFPHINRAHLPGITVPTLTRWWQTHDGAACTPPHNHPSELGGRWKVLCPSHNRHHRLSIVYDTDTTVRAVTLECTHPPGSPACHTLYPFLINTITPADIRDEITTWTHHHIDRDATTRIGHLRLLTTLAPHQVQLYPAE